MIWLGILKEKIVRTVALQSSKMIECMVDKHPDGKFDRWYTDERLHWALWCKNYAEGKPIHIGVEGDIK